MVALLHDLRRIDGAEASPIQSHIPRPVRIPHRFERLAAFDCVLDADSGWLDLIAVRYPDLPFAPGEISVWRDGRRLSRLPPVVVADRGHDESSVHIRYRIENGSFGPGHALTLAAGGAELPLIPNQLPPAPGPVTTAVATLFKDDYWILPAWLDHYRRLGCDRFLLYYNGPLERLRTQLAELGAETFHDCTFVEWDFAYWLEERIGLLSRLPQPRRGLPLHHAQPTHLLHVLRTFCAQWGVDWIGFFDLDEFLYFEDGTTFRTLTAQSPDRDLYLFESRWAEDRGDPDARGAGPKDSLVNVYAMPETEGPDSRTKYLVRPSRVVQPGVHRPHLLTTDVVPVHVQADRATVLHLHNITHDRRGSFLDKRDDWRPVAI